MFQKTFHYVTREALERIVFEKTPPSASNLTYKFSKKLLQKKLSTNQIFIIARSLIQSAGTFYMFIKVAKHF